MKSLIHTFLSEPVRPAEPLRKIDFAAYGVRLAVPENWTVLSPFCLQSPDADASLSIARVQLPGPMDAQDAAAHLAETAGWQLLAFRQLGSRDDAEVLCRQSGKFLLARVLQCGVAHWCIRAEWDAPSTVEINLLHACIRSFHGDAAPAAGGQGPTVNVAWRKAILPIPCPAGWDPQAAGPNNSILCRPSTGGPSRLRLCTAHSDTSHSSLFNEWRSELEREGYTVYAAKIVQEPDSQTFTAHLSAERDGQLFDAPAMLVASSEGTLLLSFLAPAWRFAAIDSAVTRRAFADFALAIQESVQRA